MMIPWQQLSTDALQGLIEAYVEREGTDYGEREVSASAKHGQILSQLKSGDIVIVFEETTESINLLTKQDYEIVQAQLVQMQGGQQGEPDS